jgi:hypothetical protein
VEQLAGAARPRAGYWRQRQRGKATALEPEPATNNRVMQWRSAVDAVATVYHLGAVGFVGVRDFWWPWPALSPWALVSGVWAGGH